MGHFVIVHYFQRMRCNQREVTYPFDTNIFSETETIPFVRMYPFWPTSEFSEICVIYQIICNTIIFKSGNNVFANLVPNYFYD